MEGGSIPAWAQMNMYVVNKMSKRVGRVVETAGTDITIRMHDGQIVVLRPEDVAPEPVGKGDRVHIISGELAGLRGKVTAIDGSDVVVKMESSMELQSLYIEEVAKVG
jgi:hypothetical protein